MQQPPTTPDVIELLAQRLGPTDDAQAAVRVLLADVMELADVPEDAAVAALQLLDKRPARAGRNDPVFRRIEAAKFLADAVYEIGRALHRSAAHLRKRMSTANRAGNTEQLADYSAKYSRNGALSSRNTRTFVNLTDQAAAHQGEWLARIEQRRSGIG